MLLLLTGQNGHSDLPSCSHQTRLQFGGPNALAISIACITTAISAIALALASTITKSTATAGAFTSLFHPFEAATASFVLSFALT